MKIYPKIDECLRGLDAMEKTINKNKGIEIQFFNNEGIWGNYDIVKVIEKVLNINPNIKEITVHPPLAYNEIEAILYKDSKLVENKIKDAIYLSRKYNVKINLLYHTLWQIEVTKECMIEKIKELINLVQNENVNILIENIHSLEEYNKRCTALEICRMINNEHLKACIDICHLHCMANIFNLNFDKFLDFYLGDDCSKYVYQIHFAATKNNDGFREKKTHGRKHDSYEEMLEDYNILRKFNMIEKNIITEVSEEDYINREDQKFEIELLEKIHEN